MEPEIITIEDSDEVEVIEDDVVMEVNEVNEVNEAEKEEAGSDDEMGSDVEIEPNSGSDYNSECDTRIQNLRTTEIIAMNDDTKMCAIHMYYSPWIVRKMLYEIARSLLIRNQRRAHSQDWKVRPASWTMVHRLQQSTGPAIHTEYVSSMPYV
ncbi:unnamed protein product [Lasius platythorax]|uniref:Uncharacterized protein n=1 Tax=Lasius platythorax TaxID=488582 RepID=A0AAV2MZE0_9HYME